VALICWLHHTALYGLKEILVVALLSPALEQHVPFVYSLPLLALMAALG
jgi:hypothetical protein